MVFGENILSRSPVDWTVTDGSMTQATINLEAGGSATQVLALSDISAVPEMFFISIIADTYTNTYSPNAYVVIKVQSVNYYYEYSVPLIDTGNGFCTVEVPTIATEYISLSFTIQSDYPVIISDWILSGPVAVDVNLDEIREEIPRLLADYNTSTYTVGQREEAIALISARLLANTDVTGQLQITYVASEACTITLRCKDNDGTELFAPILYDVKVGRGSIGVPHAYLKRLRGMHTFVVTAQCSTGTLTFHTRSILYTIDAGYLAKRTIDVPTDLQDIALQQLPTDETPSYIYAVGVDIDGVIRVRYRPYSESAAIVWEPAYQYEPGLTAAIEFNGSWKRRLGNQFFTLECEAKPWVFWVTPDGTLKGQKGDEEDTLITLDTGVSLVRAVRGFKSDLYVAQDQGLVVAYLKSGVAYYRNYCFQENETTIWEEARVLTDLGTGLTNLHVHRLNDYRLGFVGSSPTGNKWLVTQRTYIAAAVPPEHFVLSALQYNAIAVVPIESQDYTITVETSFNEAHTILYATCNYPVYIRASAALAFDITSSVPISFSSIIAENNVVIFTLASAVASAVVDIVPRLDYVVAKLPGGYRRMPETAWHFELTQNGYLTESFILSPEAAVSIEQKYLATLYGHSFEHFMLNPDIEAVIVQKALEYEYGYTAETFVLNASCTVSIVSLFVGIEPI